MPSIIKNVVYLIVLILLTSCKLSNTVNINVNAPGVVNGTVLIKNRADSMVYSGNIKNGSLMLKNQQLNWPDYHKVNVYDNITKKTATFEIYFEAGDYTITIDTNLSYPKVKSGSKVQEELSDYYQLEEKFNPGQSVATAKKQAFMAFIKSHPQSVAAGHILSTLYVEADASSFYALYQKLSKEAQESDDGKEVGEKLRKMVALMPGNAAPTISGITPDGKPFDKNKLDKKLYLVDFWKSGNALSRSNHREIMYNISQIKNNKAFGIISISLDKKRDYWTSAIKDDNLNWLHFSDLKGNESVNTSNWNITRIPTYYVVDGSWHIVAADISPAELVLTANEYLAKHQ